MAALVPMDETPAAPQPTVEVVEDVEAIPEEIAKKFTEFDNKVDATRFVKVKIHQFSLIKDLYGRVELPEFTALDMQWRFLFFPRGNNNEANVSVYWDFRGPPKEAWWGIPIQFVLTAHSEDDELTYATSKDAKHRFTTTESDWGFTQFVKRAQFYSDEVGKRFLVNDTATVSIAIHVLHDPYGTLLNNFAHYDSKKMTGYNGLKNQGATCYMNSILQSLFFTNSFRKAVYQIPLEEDKAKNVSYALQKVFYNLQSGSDPVGTTELTKSFGWDLVDSFMQHDVQEFNRVLCDNLETKMKGTPAEGTVQKLLEGQYKMYIKCINVDYESSRVETFYDVQLNVKGLKNLEESFKNYIEIEVMDGDNKYMAAGHGLQDAKKGVIFEKYPPVLHLQLKRFEYDMMRDANVKINDRHEFPLSIDLRPFMLDPDTRPPQIYHLHGVLVHSGDSHGGHYCAFIRPKPHGDWYKFDDDRVTKCSQKEAMDDNFGADLPETPAIDAPREVRTFKTQRKFTNAYMLVYIRETELDSILCDVTDEAVPAPIRERIEKDREELARQRQEKEQEIHFMDVSVITDETIRQNDNQAELFTKRPEMYVSSTMTLHQRAEQLLAQAQPMPGAPKLYRVKKSTTLKEFKDMVARDHRVPNSKFLRCWNVVQRQNATIRPDSLLVDSDDVTLEQIRAEVKTKIPLHLYIQLPPGNEDMTQVDPDKFYPPIDRDSRLIFFKHYDPAAERLSYVGPQIVRVNERLMDIAETLNKIVGYLPKTTLRMYEEIRPDMTEEHKVKTTYAKCELGTGDILIFQKDLPADQAKHFKFPTAKAYLEYLLHRVVIRFKPRDSPRDLGFTLTLHQKMPYDDVAKRVGEHLKHDPMKLRFTSHRTLPEGPYGEIKRHPELQLEQMLSPYTYGAPSDILYYEKLDISIIELESKLAKKVTWMNAQQREDSVHHLLLQKGDTVASLLEALKPKVVLRGEQHKKIKAASPEHADMSTDSPAPTNMQSPPSDENVSEPMATSDSTDAANDAHKKIKPETAAGDTVPMDIVKEEEKSPMIAPAPSADEAHSDDNAAAAPMAGVTIASQTSSSQTSSSQTSSSQTSATHAAEEKGSGVLRAYEVKDSKIVSLLDSKVSVADILNNIVVEEIPQDQVDMDPRDKLLQVCHFHRDTYNFHSLPFLYRTTPTETLADFKARLRKTLAVSEKEFSKYKFAYIQRQGDKPEYLENDADVLLSVRPWSERDLFGIDHPDKSLSRGRYSTMEKALVIRN